MKNQNGRIIFGKNLVNRMMQNIIISDSGQAKAIKTFPEQHICPAAIIIFIPHPSPAKVITLTVAHYAMWV